MGKINIETSQSVKEGPNTPNMILVLNKDMVPERKEILRNKCKGDTD